METKVEKERKWLLKKLPENIWDDYDEKYQITQFYTPDGWRYRKTYNCDNGDDEYIKLKKIPVERGVNHEVDTQPIASEEYYEKWDEAVSCISKDRMVMVIDGKRFEFDDFDDLKVAMLEIEDVDMYDTIVFPDWLERYVLMEVTGNPMFSNFYLGIRELEIEEEVKKDE